MGFICNHPLTESTLYSYCRHYLIQNCIVDAVTMSNYISVSTVRANRMLTFNFLEGQIPIEKICLYLTLLKHNYMACC